MNSLNFSWPPPADFPVERCGYKETISGSKNSWLFPWALSLKNSVNFPILNLVQPAVTFLVLLYYSWKTCVCALREFAFCSDGSEESSQQSFWMQKEVGAREVGGDMAFEDACCFWSPGWGCVMVIGLQSAPDRRSQKKKMSSFAFEIRRSWQFDYRMENDLESKFSAQIL